MTAEIWPVPEDARESTPLFHTVINKETNVPLMTPDEDANVDPQEPGVITGYRKHTQQQVDAVNSTKAFENDLGDWLAQLSADLGPEQLDGRWISIARTHFQQGFMALNRAVFQPESRL